MFTKAKERLKKKFLKKKQVYILPTKVGFYYLLTSSVIAWTGVTYSNNTILLIGFLLISVFLSHLIITNFNLKGLSLEKIDVHSYFAGAQGKCYLEFINHTNSSFLSLRLSLLMDDHDELCLKIDEIPPGRSNHSTLVNAKHRGVYKINALILWTRYPLGFFRSWSYSAHENFSFCVYPKPFGLPLQVRQNSTSENQLGSYHNKTQDDFSEHTRYSGSEPFQRIDWKIFSRTQNLYIKNYDSKLKETWEFVFSEDLPKEQSLSQLSLWIWEAYQKGAEWKLRMPRKIFNTQKGQDHLKNCLEHLASYE